MGTKLNQAHKANPVSVRLATSAADAFRHIGSLRDPIPGVGPITALTPAFAGAGCGIGQQDGPYRLGDNDER
jgi:hypothetical protein